MATDFDQLAMVRRLKNETTSLQQEVAALKSGGGSGTLPPVEIVDAKIAASEARTDTKFAELRGDLSKFATKGTVWGAIGTAVGIMLAVMALAGNRFDAGMSVRAGIDPLIASQSARDARQDQKLDAILARLPESKPSPPAIPSVSK